MVTSKKSNIPTLRKDGTIRLVLTGTPEQFEELLEVVNDPELHQRFDSRFPFVERENRKIQDQISFLARELTNTWGLRGTTPLGHGFALLKEATEESTLLRELLDKACNKENEIQAEYRKLISDSPEIRTLAAEMVRKQSNRAYRGDCYKPQEMADHMGVNEITFADGTIWKNPLSKKPPKIEKFDGTESPPKDIDAGEFAETPAEFTRDEGVEIPPVQ